MDITKVHRQIKGCKGTLDSAIKSYKAFDKDIVNATSRKQIDIIKGEQMISLCSARDAAESLVERLNELINAYKVYFD